MNNNTTQMSRYRWIAWRGCTTLTVLVLTGVGLLSLACSGRWQVVAKQERQTDSTSGSRDGKGDAATFDAATFDAEVRDAGAKDKSDPSISRDAESNDADLDATVPTEIPTSPEQACALAIAGAAADPAVLLAAALGAPLELVRTEMSHGYDEARLLSGLRDACLTGPALSQTWRDVLRWFGNGLLWAEILPFSCEEPPAVEFTSIAEIAAAMEVSEDEVTWLCEEMDVSWRRFGELLSLVEDKVVHGSGILNGINARAPYPGLESPFHGLSDVVWNYRPSDDTHVIGVRQPYDHANPDGPTFVQSVEISLQRSDMMNVVTTSTTLLDSLFVGNLIHVAPRYEGGIYPAAQYAWDTLLLDQEVADVHHVLEVLKPVLTGPWVSMGERRDAATALRHQMLHPEEIVATVAYYPDLGTTGAMTDSSDAGAGVAARDTPIARLAALDTACAARVKHAQQRILEDLPEILERGSSPWCLRRSDSEMLWGWATLFEWTFWAAPYDMNCDDIPTGALTDDALDVMFSNHLYGTVYFSGITYLDAHRNVLEWGLPWRLRPEFQTLALQSRLRLDLPPGEPSLFGRELVAERPQSLVELRQWVNSGTGAVLAVLEADDPLDIWPFASEGHSLTVGGFNEGEYRFSTDVRDAPLEVRDAIRAQLEVWQLSKYIRNESFIDRERE